MSNLMQGPCYRPPPEGVEVLVEVAKAQHSTVVPSPARCHSESGPRPISAS